MLTWIVIGEQNESYVGYANLHFSVFSEKIVALAVSYQ
jgi:hypothetical protein